MRWRRRGPARPDDAGTKRRKARWWELPALLLVALVVAFVTKTFVVQPFFIPSDSMEHTLYGCPGCHGDRILVDKPVYDFRAPHPGDIVVFHAPPGWEDEPHSTPPANPVLRAVRGLAQQVGFVPPDGEILVKRVIATGGESIKGSASGAVFVSDNGPHGTFRKLDGPFVDTTDPTQPQPVFGPVTVPKGRLWVMGDHRTDSEDSRWHCSSNGESEGGDASRCATFVHQATVPVGNVIGKAIVIAWPPSRWRTLGTPSTFKTAADAAGPTLPGVLSMGAVVPVFLFRRRSRRKPDREGVARAGTATSLGRCEKRSAMLTCRPTPP